MKILVTGAGGFVGSHLCDLLLEDDNELIGVIRNESRISNLSSILNKIKLNVLDITNFSELEKCIDSNKPDVIVHLAGETSHSKSFENPLYDLDVNTKSTLFILEKIRSSNLNCKFILGSSFIVVGRPLKLPINESSPCNPTTIYGANRLASEHYCSIYNNVYGLDTVTFRITNSFGPREQFLTPKKNAINYLLYKAFKGEEITIYNQGQFFRDLIYISNVVSGINTIIQKGKPGNLYWISSGKKTWFYEMGKLLEELTGTKVKYIEAPEYTKKVDVGNFLVDNSKLMSLGWKPETTIKDGIKQTLDYFKSTLY